MERLSNPTPPLQTGDIAAVDVTCGTAAVAVTVSTVVVMQDFKLLLLARSTN